MVIGWVRGFFLWEKIIIMMMGWGRGLDKKTKKKVVTGSIRLGLYHGRGRISFGKGSGELVCGKGEEEG